MDPIQDYTKALAADFNKSAADAYQSKINTELDVFEDEELSFILENKDSRLFQLIVKLLTSRHIQEDNLSFIKKMRSKAEDFSKERGLDVSTSETLAIQDLESRAREAKFVTSLMHRVRHEISARKIKNDKSNKQ